ncbi:MAG: DUF3641 domain-containing protein [Planctomycetaceae bacterium]|nr:MAG: DUF3641 domain-containing protein [Planctomycetaceae bacterium]
MHALPHRRGADASRDHDPRYGIVFNRLITITNMAISRFLDHLQETGQYDEYMERLIGAYNPAAAAGVMCRKSQAS